MLPLELHADGVILHVQVQARARRTGIVDVRAGMLRVAVAAAPEKGKANRAVVDVLSRGLGVPKSAVQLIGGETSPRKRFLVTGATADEMRQQLERVLPMDEGK